MYLSALLEALWTLDGCALKVVTIEPMRARACHQTFAQARESTAVNRIDSLSMRDCRANWRGVPVFKVT